MTVERRTVSDSTQAALGERARRRVERTHGSEHARPAGGKTAAAPATTAEARSEPQQPLPRLPMTYRAHLSAGPGSNGFEQS